MRKAVILYGFKKTNRRLPCCRCGVSPLFDGRPARHTALEEVPLDKLSPAPTEWNFYAPLPDDKLLELIESIRANDLLHPIVVWKQPDGALMILSGHNRVRAYTALLEKTGEDKYRRIPATVLTDITADEAHEIVVDSNYVQRVLTPSEKARSISQKYALAGRKKRSRNGVRKSKYEQIGEEYNLSARQIARYVRLGSLDGSCSSCWTAASCR